MEWTSFLVRKKIKNLWTAVPLCLIWAIRKERNRIVFKNMPFFYPRLKHSFISLFSFWAGFLDLGEDSFVRNFFVYSLSCFARLVGVFCSLSPCLTGFLPAFFLYTVGNRISVSPLFVIIFAMFLPIKKNEGLLEENKNMEGEAVILFLSFLICFFVFWVGKAIEKFSWKEFETDSKSANSILSPFLLVSAGLNTHNS